MFDMIRTGHALLRSKRAEGLGWEYIVAIVIGLAVLVFLFWLAAQSTMEQKKLFEGLW